MRSRAVVVASILGIALVTGGWYVERGLGAGGSSSAGARARLFDEVVEHVSRNFVDSLPDSVIYQKAVAGVVRELNDPHSAFLSRERLQRLGETTTGRYAGVGVQIDTRDGWIMVLGTLPKTPAQRAGVQTGDRVMEIDGRPTTGWTADEAINALRGPSGSTVRIAVERPGLESELDFALTREQIRYEAVQHALLLGNGVGYVDLVAFSTEGAVELRRSIDSLSRAGMTSLILDLRGNPGGLLEQGVAVSELFLPEGRRVVSMRGRTADANREFLATASGPFVNVPMVVIVDSSSASASEIVAGALQDNDRAAVIGTTSYGKGSAQSVFPMPDGSGLKLTTARWFTPLGRSISMLHRGSGTPEEVDDDEDGGDAGDAGGAAVPGGDSISRPRYATAGGRTVYGGGGITPDLIVPDRVISDAERAFQLALGTQLPAFQGALTSYALELRTAGRPLPAGFTVTPEMREALWSRMHARGIRMERSVYDSASAMVGRLIGDRVAQYAIGGQASFVRAAREDEDVIVARALLEGAKGQKDVLDRVKVRAAAPPPAR